MSTPSDEIGFWREAFYYIWAIVLALIGIVWHQHGKRIDGIDAALRDSALDSRAAIDRQQLHIDKLLDRLEETNHRIEARLESLSQRSEQRHIELVRALHEGLAGKADK